MQDVKIPGGNNRQFDLLAISLKDGSQYHVESSVTHVPRWCPDSEELKIKFDRKFLGYPAKREGPKRDFAKGKNYRKQIWAAYRMSGIRPKLVQRIWVAWTFKDPGGLQAFLRTYERQNRIRVTTMSMRDEILPELQNAVATSNYDDEVLRTLSLLKQMDRQRERKAEA